MRRKNRGVEKMENMNKLVAVARIKWLCVSRNTAVMIGPFMVLGMVWGCKILYGLRTDGKLAPMMMAVLLNLGITMNICTNGFLTVGTAIAEEKEKHTLRVLMTSSITGIQYFIGSILYPFVLTVVINFAILWVSGISMEQVSIPAYFLVSIAASLISCVIGMIVGICADTQMNANLIGYPLLIVFMMIPMFGNMSDGLRRISGFLFTGVVTKMTDCFANGVKYTVEPLDIAVLFGELIISALVFLVMYRRNGYEKD